MTTRFTSSAKVKVIVKAEVAIAVACHLSLFCDAKLMLFLLSAKQKANYFTICCKNLHPLLLRQSSESSLAAIISRKGTMTKSRSSMRGWGNVSVGVDTLRLSYRSKSMSMGRS